ncbi:cytochrome c-type biogenesis protein [Litoribrevibacter albus]|uniref:Cytochrome c-type biogenesis protein n=1 Tax=Litoribrevibacter albus TaxID=1473156 RepID=A0AA37SCI4_9GAMM|nr:cytochrome c-type biogenesis protein [Litoribrevibacter albus]GLQ32378.1 cytochrome c-type biogenesis protein CcmH [Litoribrevibacter albus]
MIGIKHSLVKFSLWAVLLFSSFQANAVIEILEFDSQAEKERYQTLIDELRCPKCQNQNLADSNAQIAVDLRNKVRELIDAGKNDEEIKAHLVARYGDFVLYRPEVKKETYVLWFGPAILLVFGALVVVIVLVANKRKASKNEPQAEPEEERQARLNKLLKENSEKE